MALWVSSSVVVAFPQSNQATGIDVRRRYWARPELTSDLVLRHLPSMDPVSSAESMIKSEKRDHRLFRRTDGDDLRSRIHHIYHELRKTHEQIKKLQHDTIMPWTQRNRVHLQLNLKFHQDLIALENEAPKLPAMDPGLLREVQDDQNLFPCLVEGLAEGLVRLFSIVFTCVNVRMSS